MLRIMERKNLNCMAHALWFKEPIHAIIINMLSIDIDEGGQWPLAWIANFSHRFI